MNNQSYERMQRVEKRRLVETGVEEAQGEEADAAGGADRMQDENQLPQLGQGKDELN